MKKMSAAEFTGDPRVSKLVDELKASCGGKKFSDIVDDEGNQYVDLVMEGGGVLGVALIGYTYALEEVGIRFLGVGGTSAGAINALLVACMGTPAERKSLKMVELLANTNLREFVDGPDDCQRLVDAFVAGAGKFKLAMMAIPVIDNVIRDLGLNPGKAFHDWLSGVLKKEKIKTTRQLLKRMENLPKGLRVRGEDTLMTVEQAAPCLALVAADVSTETKVEFPKMAPMYWDKPESVNPADYVRASMSIPFFFHPFRVEDVPQGEAAQETWKTLAHYEGEIPQVCTFVDGGIMSNFPIDLFHQPLRVPQAPTFGAKLGKSGRHTHEISGPADLLGATFDSARHCLDYDFLSRNPDYKKLMAWIDTGAHNWLNFGMSREDKMDLFYRGVLAAKQFLVDFDWDGYKQVRAQLAMAHATMDSE